MDDAIQLQQQIDLTLNRQEQARLRCELAKTLIDAGNYEGAREAMGDLWQRVGTRPQLDGLDRRTCAEVLLLAGTLTGWVGSTHQIEGAQEIAKNLITQSLAIFESVGERRRVAEGQTELAVCYWREGAFDEALVTLNNVIGHFSDAGSEIRAVALLRRAIAERSMNRFHDALHTLTEAAPLFDAINIAAFKGNYHNTLANVLKNIGEIEKREDYVDRALVEYSAASFYFEETGHRSYLAAVKNNLGLLYLQAGKLEEAHEQFDEARRLFSSLKDDVHLAQVDEVRARAFLAQNRLTEAERVARYAVLKLGRGDELALLAEALTTHGVALARTGERERSEQAFQRAIDAARRAGDRRGEGMAALVLIEECGRDLDSADLRHFYQLADQLLAPYPETADRLHQCAQLVSFDSEAIAKRVSALNEQAWGTHKQDAKTALELSLVAYQLAESILDRRGQASALRTSAACRLLLGEHEPALSGAAESLRLFEELDDRAGMADALRYLGNAAARQSDYQRCIDTNLRGFYLRESLGDRQGQAYALNSLGIAYSHLCDYGTALDYFLRSLRIKEELDDRRLASSWETLLIIHGRAGAGVLHAGAPGDPGYALV